MSTPATPKTYPKFWWRWPPLAVRAHIFPMGEARAVCGGWAYTGLADSEVTYSQTDGTVKSGKDDCRACVKRLNRMILEKEKARAGTSRP